MGRGGRSMTLVRCVGTTHRSERQERPWGACTYLLATSTCDLASVTAWVTARCIRRKL